jgi:hypothetical protein
MDVAEPINGVNESVIKGGETCMEADFRRGPRGLTVMIKVHPSVEEFVKSLGSGLTTEAKVYGGRYWYPIGGKELMVYDLTSDPGTMGTDTGVYYTINRPGGPLQQQWAEEGRVLSAINLAFLRLEGISGQDGITFGVKGVFTYKAVEDLAKATGDAFRRFYIEYMKPINSDIKIIRQQW